MSSAKFFLMGEVSHWVRVRVAEEIHSHGLEGNVVNAGAETLAVIVEGDRARIEKLYRDLKHAVPNGIAFTQLHYRKPLRTEVTSEIPREELDRKIISLLSEIEKGVRRLNQKLDAALEGGGGAASAARPGGSDSAIGGGSSSGGAGWSWTEGDGSAEKEGADESSDSVSSFFDSMP